MKAEQPEVVRRAEGLFALAGQLVRQEPHPAEKLPSRIRTSAAAGEDLVSTPTRTKRKATTP